MVLLCGISSEPQPTAVLSCNHLAHNKKSKEGEGDANKKGLIILWDQSFLPGRKEPHQISYSQSQKVPNLFCGVI